MDLESYAEIGAEIKQLTLLLDVVEVHDDSNATTPQRDHRSCLIIRLGDIRLKVSFVIVRREQMKQPFVF